MNVVITRLLLFSGNPVVPSLRSSQCEQHDRVGYSAFLKLASCTQNLRQSRIEKRRSAGIGPLKTPPRGKEVLKVNYFRFSVCSSSWLVSWADASDQSRRDNSDDADIAAILYF
ncbi:hypothetical protein RRG08_058047 [Elysia crispata]|uniref:Uncharacterized protein n=1 Tax=Elysia crispata TaxID=231223 RepID=A0AAE1A8N0_9GAST|nr:hypothetical protein RRG08_058047 [Elysia crispata]